MLITIFDINFCLKSKVTFPVLISILVTIFHVCYKMEWKMEKVHFQRVSIRQESVSKLRDLYNRWKIALIVSIVVVVIITTVTIYFHLHRNEDNITLELHRTTETSVNYKEIDIKRKFTNLEAKTSSLTGTVTNKVDIGKRTIKNPDNTKEYQVSTDIHSNIAGHSGNVMI